jgi:type IX secretion system PorP/SprF family membrane protein
MKRLSLLLILLVGISMSQLKAQSQMHYGMYMMHQPFFNPASMGSYNNLTAAVLYKTQWVGYEGAPKIGVLNLLKPLGSSAVGLTITNDQIGIDNNTEIAGSYSYTLRLRGYSRLAFGLSASVNLLQSDLGAVDILDINDPAYSGGKTSLIPQPNVKFGTYYFNHKFYIGLAIPNILENKISFAESNGGATNFDVNTMHYYLHSGYRFKLNEKSDLNASTLIKQVSGSSLQYDLNLQYEYNRVFGVGGSYRSSQELLGILSYQLTSSLKMAYAYEYNLDQIGNYSTGSHEIMLIYQFNPPKETVIAIPRF